MKKELKDYLHFYLGCNVTDGEHIMKLLSVGLYGYVAANDNVRSQGMFRRIKPILRRFSDMTEQEYNEWDNIHPLITGTSELIISEAEKTKYLLSKHFDLFGLIDAGIAIDATTTKAET